MYTTPTPYEQYLAQCLTGVLLHVRLGSPRTADCHGLGICRMELAASAPLLACGSSLLVRARIDPPTDRLLLHISPDTLTPALRARYFRDGYFGLPRAFAVPTTVLRAIGKDGDDYRIPGGRYPMLDDGTFLTLSLPLRDRQSLLRPLRRAA